LEYSEKVARHAPKDVVITNAKNMTLRARSSHSVLLFLWPTYSRKCKEIGRHYGKRLKNAHNTIKIRHARDIVVGAGADIVGIDQHGVFFEDLC
jgi:hypothetical protein